MIGVKLDKLKSSFFDRAKVLDKVDKATVRNLSKAGAYIRRTAKGLIRKVGKKGNASKPGTPPKSRTGVLRDRIVFIYDDARRSVVVGPAGINQTYKQGDGKPTKGTVPEVLEYGGEINVLEYFADTKDGDGAWLPAKSVGYNRNVLKGKQTRLRVVKIEARPYMGPAYQKNEKVVADFWRDSVRP